MSLDVACVHAYGRSNRCMRCSRRRGLPIERPLLLCVLGCLLALPPTCSHSLQDPPSSAGNHNSHNSHHSLMCYSHSSNQDSTCPPGQAGLPF